MVLTLYKLDASAPVRSVLMVLHVAKISNIQFINVNTLKGEQFTEEYLKMNPQHSVPTLKDGDFVIWDSHAISVYLLKKYTQDDSLYPVEHQKRALIDQRLHFDSGILFIAMRSAVDPVVFLNESTYRPEALMKIKAAYEFTDKFLTRNWLAGDELTLADICCVATISSLNEVMPIDPSLYPNLAKWFERCKQQDFYKKGNEPGLEQFGALLKSKVAQ
ncbi:unnamed protein product, partial [Iphiclides podalirius]